ncbi:g2772 [Coccomyxa elongata]
MSNLRLYTFPGNKNAWKAQIAAEYVGVKLDVPAFEMGKTNKSPQFLKLNPNGKVPTLQTPEGAVWESNAIARYVARLADKGLFGVTAFDAALVEQWIEFSTLNIDAPMSSWLYPLLGFMDYDKKKEEAAIVMVKKNLDILDEYLASHTYLVGNSVTLADIIGAANLYHGYTKLFDEAFRKDFPNVQRWFLTLVNQPAFKNVMGDVVLAKETMKYTPKKNDKAAPAAKESKPAAPKESKPEQPKKESKPAPAKEAAAADNGEEKPAPKPKDPLALLPPSKMIMDSWKRLYSNTPGAKFKEICVNGLWNGADVPNSPTNEHFEGFDPEGYSIWFCEYKYPEENTVNFIVMNKVGGFLQRIDYVRKHAFAVMSILKDDKGQFPIRGMWIFRGQEIPAIMQEECFDLPLYEWTKVDTNDAAVRERISALLCEEDKIDGLENVEVKVFK